jgi:tetratricopeptide (TPR) repeat protein
MLRKALHTGNIAASISVAATAADVTFAGGAVTTISVTLSTLAIFKKGDRATKDLSKQIATAMEAAFAATSLPKEQLKHVAQMLFLYPVTEGALAKGNLDAGCIATDMCDHIAGTAIDPAHKTEAALSAYMEILTDTLAPVLVAPAGVETLNFAILKEMLARSETSGQSNRLREEGITEKAIIRLAQRIANDTDEVGQAWLELQNAMDMAVSVQAAGKNPSNHGEFVNNVLAHVAEFAKDGDYTAASAEIEGALAKADAETARLLSSGIEIALLDRDTAKAATLLIRKADLDAGGAATFEKIRALQRHHIDLGRDTGSRLNFLLGIDLGHRLRSRATTQDERSVASSDLAISFAQLGERDSDTTRLEQAVTAFNEALKEVTQASAPMHWAAAQINLGNALCSLGQRDSDTTRLEQAVTAFNEALKEFTQASAPMDWAKTQSNLATVEIAFFDILSYPAHLTRATEHATRAQKVFKDAQSTSYLQLSDQQIADIATRKS